MENNLLNNRQIMQIKNTWDKESIRKTIDGGKHILWVIALSVCLLILQGFADLKIETGNQGEARGI